MARATAGILFLAIPFVCAGRVGWFNGWLYAGVMALTVCVNLAVIAMTNPGLLRARLSSPGGTKEFDRIFGAVSTALSAAMLAVAGLDERFGWSAPSNGWVSAGVILHVCGMIPVTWAMAANPFLERTVRIQTERGHRTITHGPYRFVRHPMYLGILVVLAGWPLMLGSFAALIPAGLLAAGFVVRTQLEDKVLRMELAGYEEYAHQTRWRLVPSVW